MTAIRQHGASTHPLALTSRSMVPRGIPTLPKTRPTFPCQRWKLTRRLSAMALRGKKLGNLAWMMARQAGRLCRPFPDPRQSQHPRHPPRARQTKTITRLLRESQSPALGRRLIAHLVASRRSGALTKVARGSILISLANSTPVSAVGCREIGYDPPPQMALVLCSQLLTRIAVHP
jgi:hypothetical protein